MKRFIQFVSACAAVAIAIPTMAFELTHSDGVIKKETTPSRIVSFDLAVLDSLNMLEVPVVGVPSSVYEGDLVTFNELPKIGSLFEPDYAALKELQPDLIFAGGRSQRAIPQLKELAQTATYTAKPTSFLDDFHKNNLALADAFGKKEQAQTALNEIDENVRALQAANAGKTGAFLFVNKGAVMTHVPGDRFGYVFDLTGLTSVLPAKDPAEQAAPRPEPGSPEAKQATIKRAEQITTIAQANPDWLIVFDRGAIGVAGEATAKQTIAEHAELSQTDAFKSNRVVYVDPNRWYLIGGGLSNLKQLTDHFLTVMHK